MARVPIHPALFTPPDDPRGPHLIAARCHACATLRFPATDACPYCGHGECSTQAVGARGVLALYTVVTARPPGYRGPLPYGFGVVDLPEGLRIVTRLTETRLEALRAGLPVVLEIASLHVDDQGDEVLSWAYAPCDDGAARS